MVGNFCHSLRSPQTCQRRKFAQLCVIKGPGLLLRLIARVISSHIPHFCRSWDRSQEYITLGKGWRRLQSEVFWANSISAIAPRSFSLWSCRSFLTDIFLFFGVSRMACSFTVSLLLPPSLDGLPELLVLFLLLLCWRMFSRSVYLWRRKKNQRGGVWEVCYHPLVEKQKILQWETLLMIRTKCSQHVTHRTVTIITTSTIWLFSLRQ